jgi:hypothetical protein
LEAVVPPGVTTRTFLVVRPAPDETANVALSDVPAGSIEVMVAVTPPPAVTEVAPFRPVPVMVTGTDVPLFPLVGVIDATVGNCTVNVTELLVPPGVLTTTV